MPRTPALCERKTNGPLKDDSTQLHGDWRTNYSSVRDHEARMEKQYDDEVKDGLMERITLGEALERYAETLVIAATGAIAKKGAEPGGDIRVIFDGTNLVYLNLVIRTRDQVRFPTACDIKAVLAELAEEGGVHWSLLFDVTRLIVGSPFSRRSGADKRARSAERRRRRPGSSARRLPLGREWAARGERRR